MRDFGSAQRCAGGFGLVVAELGQPIATLVAQRLRSAVGVVGGLSVAKKEDPHRRDATTRAWEKGRTRCPNEANALCRGVHASSSPDSNPSTRCISSHASSNARER
jgi:hypothetical protein